MCGMKSIALADSVSVTVECHKLKSADWHEVNVAFKIQQIWKLLTANIVIEQTLDSRNTFIIIIYRF